MRRRLQAFFIVTVLMTLGLNTAGCSRFSRPLDDDVLKAIAESGILKSDSFTITSPLAVVERGERREDGSWPVMVKMTMIIKLPNGKISEPRENTTRFRIVRIRDASGRAVWKAVLGS